MTVEELIEDVLSKWSQRGYIEPEMVGSIAAALAGELHVDPGPLPRA